MTPIRHDLAVPTLLDRALYDVPLAASILDMSPSTLYWWLDGRTTGRRHYDPVLRPEPTGSREVTWGELVEARYLKAYREELGVRLGELREFIGHLRKTLGVRYPLAHAKPWVGEGRTLLVQAQEEADLDPELAPCYSPSTGKVLLTAPAQSFLRRVDFEPGDDGIVIRLYPAGKDSPVVIDPELRAGSPSVRGISTDAIAEAVRAGDPIEQVVTDYELSLDDVVAALDFERVHASLAA